MFVTAHFNCIKIVNKIIFIDISILLGIDVIITDIIIGINYTMFEFIMIKQSEEYLKQFLI